jgi:hypothetical protein
MVSRRVFLAVLFYILLCASKDLLSAGSGLPMGILTRAHDAQLNFSDAYAGLSVFEGEALSVGSEGKLGVRVGTTNLAFSQGAQATMQRIEKGTHVDILGGSVFFAAPENTMVEVHIAEALLRPDSMQGAQAEVKLLAPKLLQVAAMRGNLDLW